MFKLLTSLKQIEAENCIILTYNLDLPFFEAGLFEPLYAHGCHNTLVICDPQQYEVALKDAPLLRYAGQRYLLFSGRTSTHGAFHPKLILLTSKNTGYLYLMSGNLSRPGYTNNWEVLTRFVFDEKDPDPLAWKAFHWAYKTIKRIITHSDSTGLARERLDRLWRTTPWLRKEIPANESTPFWTLDNLSLPLLDQIESLYHQLDNHPITRAIIISPYFDYEARAFEALITRFQPKAIHVYTQSSPTINPKALTKILKEHPTKLTISELGMSRRLHAKALVLETKETSWLATGSANFSAPALLRSAQQGNTELLSLRYEPNRSYYNEWVNEAIKDSIALDWKELPEVQAVVPQTSPELQLKLEATRLTDIELELLLLPTPKLGSDLTIKFSSEETIARNYRVHAISAEGWITVILSKEISEELRRPTLISITEITLSGKTIQSNSILLHNITALEQYSKPPNTANRPKIPFGLIPDNTADYVWLLEMIHDLLITNHDQLMRHNPHIVAQRKTEIREEQITEEYIPEDHIVAEPIRLSRNTSGIDGLYMDFEKRWTYQEILNSVLAATYNDKAIEVENNIKEKFKADPSKNQEEPRGASVDPPQNDDLQRLRNRISNGFSRLVENFEQGLSDQEYLATIPPSYLLELWLIITRYLQVVWKNELLDRDTFCDLSLDMLFSFWGKPAQPGAWQMIKELDPSLDLQVELQRLSLPSSTWLYVALLSNLLDVDDDDRQFDLAGWMRMFATNITPPDHLSAIGEEAYKAAWHNCFPQHFSFLPAKSLAEALKSVSQQYDDEVLQDEIKDITGCMPKIEYGKIADLLQAPKMMINMPLTDLSFDMCIEAFQLFLTKPKLKPIAWVRFENINPVLAEDDIRSITIFFRNDTKIFLFAAERMKNQSYKPEYEFSNINLEQLKQVQTLLDIIALQS
jgi:hypothetical protein